VAVASAGPYASLHLAADRLTMPAPHHSICAQSVAIGCMLAMQRDNNDDDKEKAGLCDLALSVVLKYE